MAINIENLHRDLEDDYGTAMFGGFSMAVIDLEDIQRASPEELIEIAQRNGIDLRRYEV